MVNKKYAQKYSLNDLAVAREAYWIRYAPGS